MQNPRDCVPMQPPNYKHLPDQRETIVVIPSTPPPRDYIVWSLFSFAHMNPFCLGFVALYFSVKARDRKVLGDINGARDLGSTARCLNIVALCLTLFFSLLFIIVLFTTFGSIKQSVADIVQGRT